MRTNPTLRGFLAGGAALALLCGATVHGGSYLLLGRGESLPWNLDKSVRSAGGVILHKIPQIGLAVVESANPAFAARAARLAGVEAVVPDIRCGPGRPALRVTAAADMIDLWELFVPPVPGTYVAESVTAPTDAFSGLQWALEAIHAPEAWEAGQSGQGVLVAILDSGIAAEHQDIKANLNTDLSTSFVPGETFDFVPVGFNHGTHVAGIVAARAGADPIGVGTIGPGTIGVAYNAEIVAVKVLSAYTDTGTFASVIEGIVYAADIDADLINMSLVATLPRSGFCEGNGTADTSDDFWVGAREIRELEKAMNRATKYARHRGTTVIASAGSGDIDRDHDGCQLVLPADCTGVIAVAATGPVGWRTNPDTDLDLPASYSNYGKSAIDLAAPGGDYQAKDASSTWFFDMVLSAGGYRAPAQSGWYFATGAGTAAAHVTGVAALIIGKHGGPMHPAQVAAALRKSADDLGKPGKDDFYGHGRVNAANAVQ